MLVGGCGSTGMVRALTGITLELKPEVGKRGFWRWREPQQQLKLSGHLAYLNNRKRNQETGTIGI